MIAANASDRGLVPLTRRVGLVTFVYLHRVAIAALVALGPAVVFGRLAARHPGGEAELFSSGAMLLVETARYAERSVGALVVIALAVLAIGEVTGIFVLGAVLDGLGREGKLGLRELADGATRSWRTLARLVIVGFVAEALVLAVVVSIALKIAGAIHFDERSADLAKLVSVALSIVFAALVGCLRDLAAASAVRRGTRFGASVVAAWNVVIQNGLRAAGAYAWRAVLGLALVAAAIASGHGVVAPLVHQLAVFGIVLLHVSWLRVCLALVGEPSASAPPEDALRSEPNLDPLPPPAGADAEPTLASESGATFSAP